MSDREYTNYAKPPVQRALRRLIDPKTTHDSYRDAMRNLGAHLGAEIGRRNQRAHSCLLICTAEDADFLAIGILEKLTRRISNTKFACFWNARTRPKLSIYKGPDLDVAPVVKRYEEPSDEELDLIVIAKSIISSGCVVRHNMLEILSRKKPRKIVIASPVMLRGTDESLRRDFPMYISELMEFMYFASDDLRDDCGIVYPGIGGSVYERLGIADNLRATPNIVLRRRASLSQNRSVSHQ